MKGHAADTNDCAAASAYYPMGITPYATPSDTRAAVMDALYAAVLKGAREGKSLEAIRQSIRLEKYKDWHNYVRNYL